MTWRRIPITAAALVWAACASGADFQGVKTVYLLPMANGLDQYLAVRLTGASVVQVVTDPRKADAIITDHVGEALEKTLDEMFGAAPVPKDGDTTQTFARVQGGQRSRGTFFLVNRKTRDVLWSDEEVPAGNSAKETRRIAARVADHLAKAMGGK
jgi:hypothetical protein